MKKFVLILVYSLASLSQASTYTKIDSPVDYVSRWKSSYGLTYAYVAGLDEDLFQRFHMKDSRGPSWKESAIETLEKQHDLHEQSSYWAEDGSECGDSEEESEEFSNDGELSYKIDWIAIKPLKGSQRTLLYVAQHVTVVTLGSKTCEMQESQYLFMNQLNADGPVLLGIKTDKPL